MSELLALSRLAIVRSRLLLLVMTTGVLIATLTVFVVGPISQSEIGQDRIGQSIIAIMLFCTLMPAAFSSIVLFNYSDEGNMNSPESGCSPWILRMPVHAWKVASVPLVLKTLWITALWAVFVVVARHLGAEDEIPFVMPAVCFSATAIWVLVLAWRPFRRGWHRIAAFMIAVPILYCCVVAVFVAPNMKIVQWRQAATIITYSGVIVAYIGGVWITMSSVKLARTNITGVIPEFGTQREASWLSGGGDQERHYKSPVHTLVSHDLIQSRAWVRKTIIVGVIPVIVIFSLFIPVGVPGVVIALWAFAYLAAIAVFRAGESGDSTLPPHLGASPLSSAAIAWARFVTPMLIATCVFFSILILFALWSCWPENRAAWIKWSSMRASDIGSTDPLTIGLRWSIVIVIASATIALGRLAACYWFAMTGRQWLNVVMAIAFGLAILVPIGVVARWFTQQTDWESAQSSALTYASYLPAIVIFLLVVKGLAVAASMATLTSRKLASRRAVVKIITIWTALTLLIATSLSSLIPDTRATYLWCLALTVLAIPLARVLILPASLAWNRHR